jgi:hypothetical protein
MNEFAQNRSLQRIVFVAHISPSVAHEPTFGGSEHVVLGIDGQPEGVDLEALNPRHTAKAKTFAQKLTPTAANHRQSPGSIRSEGRRVRPKASAERI